MIQRAMKESHVNLKLNQPAKKQALETIAILKKTMRIERKQMLIRLVGRKRSRNVDSISHLAEGAIKELCEAEGIQLIDKAPRGGAEGLSIAFLHPKSTGSVLVELCEDKNGGCKCGK